jgi:hypothetical protein
MGSQKMSLKRAAELCAGEFTVRYGDGSEESIWVRTLTQVEREESEDAQAAAMMDARKKFGEGSARRTAIAELVASHGAEELVDVIVQAEFESLVMRAHRRARGLSVIEEPDLDSAKGAADRVRMQEDYERKKRERDKLIEESSEVVIDERRQELRKVEIEKVRQDALTILVRNGVFGLVSFLPQDYRVFYGVYLAEDHSQRYFDTIEEVRDLPDRIREQLWAVATEVDQIRPCEIKPSRGASVPPTGSAEITQESTEALLTGDSPGRTSRKRSSPGGQRR